jgi:hypothetical protein
MCKGETDAGSGETTAAVRERPSEGAMGPGHDELENESIDDEIEEQLAEAKEELESAHRRIERLEMLLDAMGVHPGFALEYILASVCPSLALRAVGWAASGNH